MWRRARFLGDGSATGSLCPSRLNARHVYTKYHIYIYIYILARCTRLTVCLCAHKVLCIYNIAMIQVRSCAQIPRCRGLTRVYRYKRSRFCRHRFRTSRTDAYLYTSSDHSPNVEFRSWFDFVDHHRLFKDLSYRFRISWLSRSSGLFWSFTVPFSESPPPSIS